MINYCGEYAKILYEKQVSLITKKTQLPIWGWTHLGCTPITN